jgi:hypothetical protein
MAIAARPVTSIIYHLLRGRAATAPNRTAWS